MYFFSPPDQVNGKPYYVSTDSTQAIWFDKKLIKWVIADIADLGASDNKGIVMETSTVRFKS